MHSPDRIAAWLARAVRVRTFLQFGALALVLLFAVVMKGMGLPGPVAAGIAVGALAWFAVVTVLAFVHARGAANPPDDVRPGE